MIADQCPQVFRVRQQFDAPSISDVSAKVDSQLSRLRPGNTIRAGESVAIAVGSRGICNIQQIVRSIVDHLRRIDAGPFIVPAMGSRGGGTAEGQRQILTALQITEQSCGCPIRACMETAFVCQGPAPHQSYAMPGVP